MTNIILEYGEVPISIGDTVCYEKDGMTGVVEDIRSVPSIESTVKIGNWWINTDRLKLIKSNMVS